MADDFNPDFQAGKSGQSHYQPTNYSDYQRGVADREGANNNPLRNWGGGSGSGGGGAGIIMLGPLFLAAIVSVLVAIMGGIIYGIPFIIVAFAFAVAFYPVAGAISVAIGYLIVELFIDKAAPSVIISWILVLPCLITMVLAVMKVEWQVETRDRYRRIRHWIRVVGFGVATNEVALPLMAPYVVGKNLAWGWNIYLVRSWSLRDGITIGKLAVIAITMLVTHFALRWWESRRRAVRSS